MTRPRGRIVMGTWIPNDPTLVAQILKISASYATPPPEGFISPITWGVEGNVIERFSDAGFHRTRYRLSKTLTSSTFRERRRSSLTPSANTTGRQ